MHGKTTYLIDNNGQIIHTWTSAYEPGRTAYLMPNGHLFRACMAARRPEHRRRRGRAHRANATGTAASLWYINYATSDYMMHHDFKVLPNGNILMLVAEKKLYADVLAAGFNPTLLDSTQITSSSGFMVPDSVGRNSADRRLWRHGGLAVARVGPPDSGLQIPASPITA